MLEYLGKSHTKLSCSLRNIKKKATKGSVQKKHLSLFSQLLSVQKVSGICVSMQARTFETDFHLGIQLNL